jgi:hypothetical protein
MSLLSRCLFAATLGIPFVVFGDGLGSGGGGRVLGVGVGVGPTDLQEALNTARSGDVILLDPGARYVGNFVLPAREGNEYITVQTAIDPRRVTLGGGRIAPEEAGLLAKIESPNSGPAIRTAPGAHHWRLSLLEIHGSGGGDLIRLGDGTEAQSRLDQVPHDFFIDRCYIHGDPATEQKRGIALNSASSAIVSSHISAIGVGGQDTQAILGWNGPGPYLIENNYLEAAGENIMFGGADPAVPNLVPSDITIRRNHFAKKPEWRREGRWTVKNLFELKSARRVTMEWNLLEYNWVDGQAGSAVVLKSVNQGGGAPWSVVEDVAIRYNIIRHSGSAFNIHGGGNPGRPTQLTRGIVIEHNLLYDISGETWGGHGAFILVGGGAADLSIDHNTVIQDGTFVQVSGSARAQRDPVPRLRLTNNLALHNTFGIKGDGRATGKDTLAVYFPDADIRRNVLAGGRADRYPPDNDFPELPEFFEQFEDPEAADYRLKRRSRFRGAGTDGGPIGADIDRIYRCLGPSRVRRHPIADCPPLVTEPSQVGNAVLQPRLVP